jgi:flagellar basal-body rod protein FlgF
VNTGLYSAVSGSIAEEKRLDVISNNLANINTVGYKKDMPLFKSVLGKAQEEIYIPQGVSSASFEIDPVSLRRTASYVEFENLKTDFSQGTLQKTESDLDLAIDGDGFFVAETPQGLRYTRQGNFTLDGSKRLVTLDGYPVMDKNEREIEIDGSRVEVKEGGEIYVDGEEIGTLKIVDFPKPYSLQKIGSCLFESAEGGFKGENYQIKQGFRELSNVNMIKEMVQMMSVLRSYQSYQKIIKTTMETIDSRTVNDLGRLSS